MLNEKQGTRLSINGWFHGPVNARPASIVEPLPITKTATKFQSIDVEFTSFSFGREISTSLILVRSCQSNSHSDVSEGRDSV